MGRYGIDYYGVGKYGPIAPVEFIADPFIALSVPIWINLTTGAKLPVTSPYIPPTGYKIGYSGVNLEWNSPTGEWTNLRLIRNSYGFPVDADDGDILLETTKAADPTHFSDYENLQQGRTYYYSIFVQQDSSSLWLRAANQYGVCVKDFNSFERMYRYLPNVYRTPGLFDITSDQENKDLQDFLKLFAFEYDLEKTLSTNLMYSSDTTFVDGRYIPTMMKQFGLKFEPEIGLKQSRILLRNAMKIYKSKGSLDGLVTYLKAFSGYDVEVNMGKNEFLDINCSSFEESVGFWTSSQSTLSVNLSGQSGIASYSESTAPSTFPNSVLGSLKVVVTTAGTVTLSCGESAPITKGIPVTPGTSYVYSIYGQSGNTARTTTLSIKWYDRTGTYLSTTTASSGTSITSGGWNARPTVIGVAPSGSRFAIPVISIDSTTLAETFYFDAAQFEQNTSVTNFEEARVLKINLIASRINELSNPNFESNSLWTTTNGTLVLSTSVPAALSKAGNSLVLRPTTAATLSTIKSENLSTVTGNATHTFSCYVRYLNEGADPGPTDTVTAVIKWYDSSNALLQTDTGTAVSPTTSDWSRPFVTGTAPTSTAYGVASLQWTPSSTSVSLVVDEALFEESPFVNSYFDGNTGVTLLSNLFWEGTSNSSRSHYYTNRVTVQGRLTTDLPNYLVAGTKFQLYFAQPN